MFSKLIFDPAVDYIQTLKTSHQDMSREIDALRHELEAARSNNQFQQTGAPNHSHGYSHVNNAFGQPPGLPPPQHPPTDSTSGT